MLLNNDMREAKYFLDTNIFLRVIVKDDKSQFEECKKLLERIHHGDIASYTSPLVLAEIQWTLKSFYRMEKIDIILALDSILALKHLDIINSVHIPTALALYRQHAVKFVDCLISSHTEIVTGRMVVVSYDKEFDALGIKRVEPRHAV